MSHRSPERLHVVHSVLFSVLNVASGQDKEHFEQSGADKKNREGGYGTPSVVRYLKEERDITVHKAAVLQTQ